jgi:hypothetical protein
MSALSFPSKVLCQAQARAACYSALPPAIVHCRYHSARGGSHGGSLPLSRRTVYQRLTQQRSFELVRVYHDPERTGHLELKVASKRRPDTEHPVNVLNGQASKALHLVPYFVFSRFQPELLELDLLLIDDPSESFDTSHVALLVEELRIAAEHAQLIVASHEQEKFSPHISARFGENDFVTMTVSDFDPDAGPHIERQ